MALGSRQAHCKTRICIRDWISSKIENITIKSQAIGAVQKNLLAVLKIRIFSAAIAAIVVTAFVVVIVIANAVALVLSSSARFWFRGRLAAA